MRPQPYIGITGFMSRKEVNWVLMPFIEKIDRPIMVGVLVSSRTLRGEANKWPNRYPKPEVLRELFPAYGNLLNLIHFNTKEPDSLLYDMCLAQDLAGPNCHGFQLNIAWPDKKVLEDYKAKAQFRQKTIVLQCGAKAIKEAGSPFDLGLRLKQYEGLIDYVLLDPSGGLGQDFHEAEMAAMLYYVRENASIDLGIGIAGGLHPENLERLRPLASRFEFGIDAEGKLRNADDHLDLPKAALYLQNADRLFREYKQAA